MRRAYAYIAIALLGWSIGPVGSKSLLAIRDRVAPQPLQVAFWAISAGWVMLFVVLLARRRLGRLGDFSGRGWAVLVAMGLFGWAGYAGALNFALAHLPLPDAVVINYLHPVFTVIFQGAAFGVVVRGVSGWEQEEEVKARPPAGRLAAGLVLCLLGVAFIAAKGKLGGLGHFGSLGAALAALFAAFAWGVYSNLGRFVAVKPGREARGLADVQTFAAMTCGVVMLGAVLALGGNLHSPTGYSTRLYFASWGPVPVSAWLVFAAMGLFLYCMGFTFWLAGLEAGRAAGGAHRLPPLAYVTPVLTMTNGWLLLHESFGQGFWEGAILIALGNAAIAVGGRHR